MDETITYYLVRCGVAVTKTDDYAYAFSLAEVIRRRDFNKIPVQVLEAKK